MLENILGNLDQIIQTNHWFAPLAAFLGGILTASNPCVLVMIPLMIGFTAGNKENRGIVSSLAFSGVFVIGLSITFTLLGIIAALGGRLLGDVGSYWKYIVALVALVMGAAKVLIESKGSKKVSSILRKIGGVLIILVGLYFLFL